MNLSQSTMNLVLKEINFKPLFFTMNLYWFQFWFFQIHICPVKLKPLEFYSRPVTKLQCCLMAEQQCRQTPPTVFLHFQSLLAAGQVPTSGHLTLTLQVTTYKNHSCKRLAPVIWTPVSFPEGVCLQERNPKPNVAI